jgi:hypothetical protein
VIEISAVRGSSSSFFQQILELVGEAKGYCSILSSAFERSFFRAAQKSRAIFHTLGVLDRLRDLVKLTGIKPCTVVIVPYTCNFLNLTYGAEDFRSVINRQRGGC